MDELTRGWLAGGAARVLWVVAEDIVTAMMTAHRVDPEARALAGELVAANLLLSAWIKGEERVTLQTRLTLPASAFTGEVDAYGSFRGRIEVAVPRPSREWTGQLLVIKYDDRAELYRGSSQVMGETAERALAEHLRQSDQVRAAVRLCGSPASGLVIERMPLEAGGCDDAAWEGITAAAAALDLGAVGGDFAAGRLLGEPLEVIERKPLRWQCRCSVASVEGMLRSLGAASLQTFADEDHGAEVTCHFCQEVRQVSEERLRALAAEV